MKKIIIAIILFCLYAGCVVVKKLNTVYFNDCIEKCKYNLMQNSMALNLDFSLDQQDFICCQLCMEELKEKK